MAMLLLCQIGYLVPMLNQFPVLTFPPLLTLLPPSVPIIFSSEASLATTLALSLLSPRPSPKECQPPPNMPETEHRAEEYRHNPDGGINLGSMHATQRSVKSASCVSAHVPLISEITQRVGHHTTVQRHDTSGAYGSDEEGK